MPSKTTLALLLLSSCVLACTEPPASDSAAGAVSNDAAYAQSLTGDDAASEDAGALDPGSIDPGEASAGGEAAPSAAPAEAGPEDACRDGLGPGDLVIDELLIESVAGAGDHGEWLEVRSTRDCTLSLRGLHGDCPSGAKIATLDVTDDVWIAPHGFFVVADSSDPVLDHGVPGAVLTWFGQPGDVLRNKGTTVTLRLGDAIIDSVTYPALKLAVGASLAFPAGCDPSLRSDWTRWQTSTWAWFPGFLGTPNAANVDVTCL
jgi:hypothetical protein